MRETLFTGADRRERPYYEDMRTFREDAGSVDAATTASAPAAAPGKSTLSEAVPVQRKAVDAAPDAAPLAAPVQRKLAESPSLLQLFSRPVQMRDGGGTDPEAVHAAAARGTATPSTSLPHADQIQASFGAAHDVS